jgi:hypothetical protein
MSAAWIINPRKRRKGGKRKMSAKQAKYFGGGRKKRRAGKRRARRTSVAVVASPVIRRSKRRSVGARSRKRRGGSRRSSRGGGLSVGSGLSLLKAGVVGGAGAVLVDIGMGQVRSFLPASMATPADANGQPQYGYFAAKALLSLALGTYGRRLPVIGKYAADMAVGGLTVMAYQFIRPMVPASLSLGYFNPAPTQRPMLRGVGKYVSGAGAYQSVPVRSAVASPTRGARAAGTVTALRR